MVLNLQALVRHYRLVSVLVFGLMFACSSVFADKRSMLYGEWGTEAQCARAPIVASGTKLSAPFNLQADWLGHGDVWCRLIWTSTLKRSSGLLAVADALCGEDAVYRYRIEFSLSSNELSIRWNQEFKNGPLSRCAN